MTSQLFRPGFYILLRSISVGVVDTVGLRCSCHKVFQIPLTIRSLSTTLPKWKKRKGATREAEEGAEESKTKSAHPKKDMSKVISAWKNITVKELSIAVDRSLEHVFEAMLYVSNADAYDHSSSRIDDVQVIREIVKRLGLRCIITSPPSLSKETGRAETVDVTPRPVSVPDLAPRPPVVTIMGHVDHGKTTLLDALRDTQVAASEAGGITQHIGAFQVSIAGHQVTFLDTPGHAAFFALRNRGAQVTDMVVLVVAADDGVMEQTRESLNMIKAANVPIIVAINKIDRGDADVERAKKMLLQEGIQLEDFGGDVQAVPISALKRTNLSALMDAILLQSEMLNLQSENKGMVEGVVLESKIDYGRGKLSSALIQRGVLRKSSILVAGTAWAKVRGIFDENGNVLTKSGPSTPVEIIGWRDLPSAGDKIYEVETEKRAKEVIELRTALLMSEKQKRHSEAVELKQADHLKVYKAALEEKRRLGRYKVWRIGPRPKEILEDDDSVKIAVVVKADVDGSVEALLDVMDTYDCHSQCRVDIVHYGVGDITESDIKLAETFSATIYGFNVKIPEKLEEECKSKRIDFRLSNIIYRLVEALKKDIETILPPIYEEEQLGEATILAIFNVTEGKKKIPVAGARCSKGLLRKDARFRLVRNGMENLYDGTLTSMRHLKNEVDTIKNGVECGLGLEDPSVIPKEGDSLICYRMVPKPQKSEWDPGF